MRYGPTLSSAAEFSQEGKLEEWVLRYLGSEDGHNLLFAQGRLRQEPRVYLRPYLLPIGRLERCSGPEPDIEFPVHPIDFENRVRVMEEWGGTCIKSGGFGMILKSLKKNRSQEKENGYKKNSAFWLGRLFWMGSWLQ